MAKEMVKETTAKETMMTRGVNYSAKQARMKKDEEELEALMKAEGLIPDDVQNEEDTQDEGSSQESTEDTQVQDEGDTQQKYENSAEDETPEDDSQLSGEEKSFKKRYGDLRRHMAKKEKEWEERFAALESDTSSVRPPKSDEDIEEWASKHPDVAAIVETIAEKKASEKFAQADKRLQDLDAAKEEADRVRAENAIRKVHSDFDDLSKSDEFHDWVEEQPKWVQDALYENPDDPKSVIRVIDLYKVDNNLTPAAKKENTKKAASNVKTKSRTSVDPDDSQNYLKESVVSKMGDKEFEERYDEIQKAMASGKFVYDMSGGAR